MDGQILRAGAGGAAAGRVGWAASYPASVGMSMYTIACESGRTRLPLFGRGSSGTLRTHPAGGARCNERFFAVAGLPRESTASTPSLGPDHEQGLSIDGRSGLDGLADLKAKHAARGGTVEVAYWAIRDAMRLGVLQPGARLVEVELAAALEMSRTPIREALRRLESDRLVDNAPRRGLVVPTATLDLLIEIFE